MFPFLAIVRGWDAGVGLTGLGLFGEMRCVCVRACARNMHRGIVCVPTASLRGREEGWIERVVREMK